MPYKSVTKKRLILNLILAISVLLIPIMTNIKAATAIEEAVGEVQENISSTEELEIIDSGPIEIPTPTSTPTPENTTLESAENLNLESATSTINQELDITSDGLITIGNATTSDILPGLSCLASCDSSLNFASSTELGQISVEVFDEGTVTTSISSTSTLNSEEAMVDIFGTSTEVGYSTTTLVIDSSSSTTPQDLAINMISETESGVSLELEGGRTLLTTTASSTAATSTLSSVDITPEGLEVSGGDKSNDPLFIVSNDSKIVYGEEEYEIEKEKIIVGHNSSDKDKFNPEIKLDRFLGETNLRIWSEENGDKDALRVGDKIKWRADKGKKTYAFYPMSAEQVGNQEGGFEYEITLNEKPATSTITLKIETTGLEFFYQPPLDKEDFSNNTHTDRCTETECFDKDGKRLRHRPENVVGSYAVYHKIQNGDYSAVGGKNYKAGKAFHIYRPKIIDSNGNWVWGKFNINETLGSLTITIPQDFLDKAIYPVVVDPTIGFTTLGVSDVGGNAIIANKFTSPEGGKAIPGEAFYGGGDTLGGTHTVMFAAYNDTGDADPDDAGEVKLSGNAQITVIGDVTAFFSNTIIWNEISPNRSYWLSINMATNSHVFYDSSTNTAYDYARTHSNDMPDPWGTSTENFPGRLSIYVKYNSYDATSSFWWNFVKKITPKVFASPF